MFSLRKLWNRLQFNMAVSDEWVTPYRVKCELASQGWRFEEICIPTSAGMYMYVTSVTLKVTSPEGKTVTDSPAVQEQFMKARREAALKLYGPQ